MLKVLEEIDLLCIYVGLADSGSSGNLTFLLQPWRELCLHQILSERITLGCTSFFLCLPFVTLMEADSITKVALMYLNLRQRFFRDYLEYPEMTEYCLKDHQQKKFPTCFQLDLQNFCLLKNGFQTFNRDFQAKSRSLKNAFKVSQLIGFTYQEDACLFYNCIITVYLLLQSFRIIACKLCILISFLH